MLDFDMLTVFIFLILYVPIFYYLKKRKKKDKPCLLLCTLFYIYIVLVIKYTQFPIFFGKLYSDAEHFKLAYNLIPIIKLTKNDVLTSILNIILFLPFGFLYFILSRFSYKKTLLAGFCTSLLIELSQVCISILTLVSFRIFDINDLIFNFLGSLLGIIVYKLFNFMFKLIIKKFKIKTNNFFDYIIWNMI